MKEIKEGLIKTAVFDMDGTIYELDGDNGGFKNSSLQKKVKANTAKFFAKKEGLTKKESESLVEELGKKNVFFSVYATEKYNITRKDFFDIVWDIDPEPIVTNYQDAVDAIKKLASKKIELILLTQAPHVWQNNVFTFLKLQGLFSEVYTGESYMHKPEMFPKLALNRHPKTILAIGDQLDTDITPAETEGFYTFHVTSPRDLLKLTNYE